MEVCKQNSFDFQYALAWHKKQGDFSDRLAYGLLKFLESKNIKVNSTLDIACGTGEFIDRLKNVVPHCTGCEMAESFIEYSKKVLPDINFFYVKNFENFSINENFDLITCNHDVVNFLERFDQWETFFNNCYKHLNKGGHLLFDVYTKEKLEGWNETIYEAGDNIDYIKCVTQKQDNKCIMTELYFVKNDDDTYDRTSDVLVESFFPTNDIINAVKKAGFNKIEFFNSKMEKLDSIDNRARIHFWAEK